MVNIQEFPSKLYSAITFVLVLFISYLIPRDESMWVFICGSGKRFAENSKYLYLHCESKPDVQNVWISTSNSVVNQLRQKGYEAYNKDTWTGKFMLLRAGIACETHGVQFGHFLGGATTINLHHGNALKKMGDDNQGSSPSSLFGTIKQDLLSIFINVSYTLVTNHGVPCETHKSAIGFSDSEAIVGPYPRLDPLITDVENEDIGVNKNELSKLASSQADNIILYAPTWRRAFGERNGVSLEKSKPDFSVLDRVLSNSKCEMKVSPHPSEPLNEDYDSYDNISCLHTGGDIYPFLKHIDYLITDYSSIFYDFSVLNRPMVFYAPDLKEYKNTRGLYFPYRNHVPGPVAESTDELSYHINQLLFGTDEFREKRKELHEEYNGTIDQLPSETIYNQIRQI